MNVSQADHITMFWEFAEIQRLDFPTRPIFTVNYLKSFTPWQIELLMRVGDSNGRYATATRHEGTFLRRVRQEDKLVELEQMYTGNLFRIRWHLTIKGQAFLNGWRELQEAIEKQRKERLMRNLRGGKTR